MKIWTEDYKKKTREQLKVEVIAEVKEKSMEQGIEQGIEQGEHKALQILLIKRFGTLPEWAESKLKEASCQQLGTVIFGGDSNRTSENYNLRSYKKLSDELF